MWAYSDGGGQLRAFRAAAGTAWAGNWVLVNQETGSIEGTVPAGEFSRRFCPVDVFADVTGFPTYLGTVTDSDGAALVDLILDRDPFMLANGPARAARPHVLIVPRRHRDGWSSATAEELTARAAAMTRVAAWYRSLDGGHVVFAANDSPPNRDYLRDLETASGAPADGGDAGDEPVTRNPRQEVQHAHLHAFYAEDGETENHESSAARGRRVMAEGSRAFTDSLGGDAVRVEGDGARLAAAIRLAARPWGGGYCSYQRGADGPGWVMPALGPSQDEFNRRLARADGLRAEPDPRLGGAVNLVRPGLADAGRLRAAQRATTEQRAGFRAFAAQAGPLVVLGAVVLGAVVLGAADRGDTGERVEVGQVARQRDR
jgi:diadenosine tetraphosphate (Ap4A) HIT family hydrolase